MRLRGLLVLSVAGLLAADAAAEDPAWEELKKLEGTWKPLYIESGGEKSAAGQLTPAMIDDFTFTIKDGKMPANDGVKIVQTTLQVDPTKKPKTMDRVFTE